MSEVGDPRERLQSLGLEIREAYAKNKRVMSFEEYFALFAVNPERQARSAAQYIKDVFDYFGSEEIRHPTVTRWKLFDIPWDGGRERLVGQEDAQARVYRTLSNFTREGRTNKLILLHGPNGSAKSTLVACIARGLEYYSALDEGALYRFNWVFPSSKTMRGSLGFGQARGSRLGFGQARGKRSADIATALGYKYVDEVIHRDDLVVTAARR